MKQSPSHVYYDLVVTNFSNTLSQSIPIEFKETRNSPIIDNANDYMLSVVRFQVDSYGLPSFMANIQPNQGNRDLMIESVTLEATIGPNVSAYQTFLIWVPRNLSARVPNPPNQMPNGFQDLNTDYYYGNHFQQYCDIVNTALVTSFNNLKTATGQFAGIQNPFLYWDSDSLKAVLYAPESSFNPAAANHVKIYFNRPLYALFNSFKSIANTSSSVTNGRNYNIVLNTNEYNAKNRETINTVSYIKIEQDWSTISNWTPVVSVLFLSGTLPIEVNRISAPVAYYENQLISNSNNLNFARILTDISTNDLIYKPNLLYTPTAEYRFIDLISNNSINDLDIQVAWRDRFGIIRPMYLLNGVTATIKLLFQKKNILE